MANETIKQTIASSQEKLFERIANLSISCIKTKLEIDRLESKLKGLEEILRSPVTEDKEIEKEEEGHSYTFQYNEILAIKTILDAGSELLIKTTGYTKKFAADLSIDESKEILTLQNRLMGIYNNFNYHFPHIKLFEEWLEQQTKTITESRNNEPLIIKLGSKDESD